MPVEVMWEDILRAWEDNETVVFVQVRSASPQAVVVSVVQAVIAADDPSWPDDTGEIDDPVPTPDGVAFWVEEWPDMQLFLSPLVAALQADGISAVIEAPSYANYPPEHVVGGYPWMKGVRVLETACTLVGEADPPRECVVASAAVYRDVGRFVVDWCADLAQGAGLVVGLSTTWFEATPAEALECWDIAVDATAAPMRVAAETATGVFRVGQVDRYRGRAMFVQGPHVGPDAIVANVNEARRILLSAPWAIYAYVKVSSDQTRALGDASLRDAWVPMPHVDNYALPFPALDATHVPDVFGLQLLGADHDLHSLDPAEWTVTQTESGQDIVEHHDTEAWFLEEGPRVALVERARRDFTPLLRTTADLVRYRRRRTP